MADFASQAAHRKTVQALLMAEFMGCANDALFYAFMATLARYPSKLNS
jgi:hypothetical protein